MTRSFRLRFASITLLLVGLLSSVGCAPPASAQGFDPAAAVGMLTDASANENGPAAPFMGLATKIQVDPLFGTATASIPIELPAGRKGMTPDLTIRYSSNSGNGPFGLGWDLQLGCIKRNTGHGVPVDYSNPLHPYDDAKGFVLMFRGGTILLDTCKDASPGPNCLSWGTSSEESWLNAQFDHSADSWTITDRQGMSYTYGPDLSSREGVNPVSAEKTFAWHLVDVQDPNSNAIHIGYYAGVGLPWFIRWGANAGAGLPDIFHVEFVYEVMPPNSTTDWSVSYRGGFAKSVPQRIQGIKVWVDGISSAALPTRTYNFGYAQDVDTGISLLTSVSETLGDANTPPPPPTTFSYTPSQHGLGAAADSTFQGPLPHFRVVTAGWVFGQVQGFLDVNGDGLPDLLDGISTNWDGDPSTNAMQIYWNRGNNRFEKYTANGGAWTTLNGLDTGPGTDTFFYLSTTDNLLFWLGDLQGDGLPDLITVTDSCSYGLGSPVCSFAYSPNTGGTLSPGPPIAWPGAPTGMSTHYWQLLDLNGDGLADLLDCTGSSAADPDCRFLKNTGAGFASPVEWFVPVVTNSLSGGGFAGGNIKTPLVAIDGSGPTMKAVLDLNGDGLPDLVNSQSQSGSGYWDVWLNTGAGFADSPLPWVAPFAWPIVATSATQIVGGLRDVNGDGLLDYVVASANATSLWTVYVNTGAGFGAGQPWAGATGLTTLTHSLGDGTITSDTMDLDGDGLVDFATSPSSGPYLQLRRGLGPRPNLLREEDNGLGASETVTYVPSTDPEAAGAGCVGGPNDGAPCFGNTECAGGTCTSPCPTCSKLPFPTWVVDTLTEHSGFSSDVAMQYTFTGGYFDRVEHQIRGFRQSVETRVADGRTTRRQFAAPPYATSTSPPWPSPVPSRPFKLVDEQVLDASGKVLTRTQVDWGVQTLAGGRVQVHPTKRTDTTFSTDGSGSSQGRTQTFQYDAYNNVNYGTTTGSGVPNPITTTTYYEAGAPCFAQPTKIIVAEGGQRAVATRVCLFHRRQVQPPLLWSTAGPTADREWGGAPRNYARI